MTRGHQIHHHLPHHKIYCCCHLMLANCERHLGRHSGLGKVSPGTLREGGHRLQQQEVEEGDRHHNGNWVVEAGGMERNYQEQDSCPDVKGGNVELAADDFLLLSRVGTVTEGVGPGDFHRQIEEEI